MAKLVKLAEHSGIYIEVDDLLPSMSGVAKAGLHDAITRTAAEAGSALKEALKAAINANVSFFKEAISDLAERPDQVELSFGLKISGDLVNVIITKIGAEANYALKLSWRNRD